MASPWSSYRAIAALAVLAAHNAGCSDAPTIACGDDEIDAYTHTYEADDFPYAAGVPGLVLDITDGDAPAPRTIAVAFAPSPEPFDDGDHSACAVLADDVTASLEAVAAVPGEAGGWQCDAGGSAICARTTLTMDLPANVRDPDASIGITDRTGTRSIPIADALVARTITPVGITDWTFHASQNVTFRWSPAADLAVLTDMLTAQLLRTDGTAIAITACRVSGPGTIACTFTAGDTGTGMFAIALTGHVAQDTAVLDVHRVVQHAATIAP